MANEKNELAIPLVTDVKKELALKDPTSIQATQSSEPELDKRADEYIAALFATNPVSDPEARDQARTSAETMGAELQKQAALQSDLLRKPMSALGKRSEDGGEVAKSLIDLKMQVEELNPNKLDFNSGWLSRTLGKLPGVGSPLQRYFSKYESAQTVISTIVQSLEQGRGQLQRDTITLTEDQKRMFETGKKLERAVQLGQLIDQKLQYKMDRETEAGSTEQKFIGEELLFPLRQRIMDLQQQLAVNQQGVLASELIIRNNKELVRGVSRALNVTVNALQIAVTVALALENQKLVLDKLTSVNKTTSDLLAGTANRLKIQGVEIQKQAASTSLDMNSLKSAFADIQSALDDLSTFRMQALPQMASSILELDRLNGEVRTTIDKMEQGKKASPALEIKLDS
ncbi:MAG: toxic anion resistance protein [Bdellovibrionales bacterium]|nr:toxic anion resistance protein [Oligoflexia bacterium]